MEREKILSEIIKSLDKYLYKTNSFIINEWNKLCVHNNKTISINNEEMNIDGKFIGVDDDGRALISIDGEISTFSNGIINL